VIRSLLKYLQSRDIAYAKRYIESCEIPMISHGRGKVVAPLSKVAMKAFFASIDCNTIAGKRDYALFSFMYDTGCRVGEVLSVKTCDLILDHGSPYVIVKGKGNKDRCLILSEKTVNTLKAYIAYFSIPYDAKTYLFHSSHKGRTEKMSADAVNTRLYAISYTAHKTCPEIPLKMHSHQIRHSAATHWFMDGINIAMISEYLGHASLETTRVYLGISREELETALRKREYMPLDQPKKYKIQGGLRGLLGL
jgi:site-specific recombinase XerD